MAMINVCKDCGMEVACRNCNAVCPLCGGEVERIDLVTYRQRQENKEDGNKDS